jgi:hypothetical protein
MQNVTHGFGLAPWKQMEKVTSFSHAVLVIGDRDGKGAVS